MANTLIIPRRVSNVHLIRYNGELTPSKECEQNLTRGICSTNRNYNTALKTNTSNEDEKVLKGSEKYNKYKRVNICTPVYTTKEACQNNCSNDERNISYQSTEKNSDNININDEKFNLSYQHRSLDKESCATVKQTRFADDKQKLPKTTEQRGVLCEILENLETDENKSVVNSERNLDLFDKSVDKTTKLRTDKYSKVQTRKFKDNDECFGVATRIPSSKIKKKYASAIPQTKGNIKHLERLGNYQDLERYKLAPNKINLSSNKYSKKHAGGLNVGDTISKDKTIPFNKGDVQNQRCGSINKYCRNTRVNDPVTIKSRLSKAGIPRSTVVTSKEDNDLAHSCTANNVCVSENHGVTCLNSNKKWNPNFDIACGDFNTEREDNSEDNTLISKVPTACTQGRKKLTLNHEQHNNSEKKDQRSHISPLGCQYKFNDFTCTENKLGNDKSLQKKYTTIDDNKSEICNPEDEKKSSFKPNNKRDGYKTIKNTHLKLNGTEVSSNFQKTGSDGIMDDSLPPKYPKQSIIKHGVIKHTLRNDKVERKLIGEQVKPTGNVLNRTKTGVIAQRLKSISGKSDTKTVGKLTSVIKKEDISNSKHNVVSQNISNERKYCAQRAKNENHKKTKTANKITHSAKIEISNEISKSKDSVRGGKSKVNDAGLIRRKDKSLSSRTINKVCQSLHTSLIDSDNRQSSDKLIVDEVNETCNTAKDTSIDYHQTCSEDIETFTENLSSKDGYIRPGLISASDVKNNKRIEKIKQHCESGKTNLRCKKCIGIDRLHNIRATGNNNSDEIDQSLADGQDGKADDHKVQQSAGEKLFHLSDLNTNSAKDICNNDEASSAKVVVCSSYQLVCHCQKIEFENRSSAENGYCNIKCDKLHNSSNCHGNNGQYENNHECAISSTASDSDVPKAIINDNLIMGNDLQYMTSARNSCRGITVNIGDSNLDLNLQSLQSDCCENKKDISLNLDDVNNGINKSTTSTDGSNYHISLPLSVSTDKDLTYVATDTLLCNINNTEIMEKQEDNSGIINTASNLNEHTSETEIGNMKLKEEPNANDKNKTIPKAKKLISPKISTKKFNTQGCTDQVKVKPLTQTGKNEKERLNLEHCKVKDKTPRTSTPCSNVKTTKMNSLASGREHRTPYRSNSKEANKPHLKKAMTKTVSSTTDLNDIPKKELSPFSDISNSSSSGSDMTIRSKKKTNSVGKSSIDQQYDKAYVKKSTRQKLTNDSDNSANRVGDGCQSTIHSKSLSSVKIANSKQQSPSKQYIKNKRSSESQSEEISHDANELISNRSKINTETPHGKGSTPSLKCATNKSMNYKENVSKSGIPIKFGHGQDDQTSLQLTKTLLTNNKPSVASFHSKPTPTKGTVASKCDTLTDDTIKGKVQAKGSSINTSRIALPKVRTGNKQKDMKLEKQGHLSQTPSPTLSRTSRSSSVVSQTIDRQATFVVINKSEIASNVIKTKSTEIKKQAATLSISSTKADKSKTEYPKSKAMGTKQKIPVAKSNSTRKIDAKNVTPSPTLSRSSRASSVISPKTTRKASTTKPGITQKNDKLACSGKSNIPSSSSHTMKSSNVSSRRSSVSSSKSLKQNETNRINNTQGLKSNNLSQIPRTEILKTRTNKTTGTKLQKPKVASNYVKQKTVSGNLQDKTKSQKVPKVNNTENTEEHVPSMKLFTKEDNICDQTYDIDDEILKTVCLSDKLDHVSTEDQIKERPFDFCEAQKTNIITNQHLQKQVQDPLIEIISKPNSNTIAPMDNIQIKSDIHSSIESVCSEQYWSASEGENSSRLSTPEKTIPTKHIEEVNISIEKMNIASDLNEPDKEIQCENYKEPNQQICTTADVDSCENPHVQPEADDCSLNALQLESENELLHNCIDSECATVNISENLAFDLMIENISQQSKHDLDTSERLINTFLMLDSRDFDKAQYVSTDYEANITPHSNLEQHFNAGNDKLSIEINEVNHCKSESKYSTDTTENTVKDVYVKTEKLSEMNTMEQLINEDASSHFEHLQTEHDSVVLIFQTGQTTNSTTEELHISENTEYTCSLKSNIDEVEYVIESDDQLSPIESSMDVLKLDQHKGDLTKCCEADICEVKTSSIPGNEQFGTKIYHQNEEILITRDDLISEYNINTSNSTCATDCIEFLKSIDYTIDSVTKSSNAIENSQELILLKTSSEGNNLVNTDFDSKGDEITDKCETKFEVKSANDTESDCSDSSSMASSSVQNSPCVRRPRRVFSKAERKQKYKQLSKKNTKTENVNITATSDTDTSASSSNGDINEPVHLRSNDTYQKSSPQKSKWEVQSCDNESKNKYGIHDSIGLNLKSSCTESSEINVNTVHIKHIMDDGSNTHAEQKLNEEETFTKIITNEHDITSHSQSQELQLILSDETLLSSVTHSVDLDENAVKNVVKRTTSTSAGSENRRAVNLDKLFQSEDEFSISVECTLQLVEDKTSQKEDKSDDCICETEEQSKSFTTVTSVDVVETVHLNYGDKPSASQIIDDTDNSTNVSNDKISSFNTSQSTMQCETADIDTHAIKSASANASTNCKPESLNQSCTSGYKTLKKSQDNSFQVFKDPINDKEIRKNENDVEQRLLNSNNCDNQLNCNILLDKSQHSYNGGNLNISNSAFAEVHDKIVICTVNNTIPNSVNDDKSKFSDDETSKKSDENNRSHTDRKHLTLNLSTDVKHNNEMGLTVNTGITHKNKSRQHVRRLTDTITFERNEGDTGSLTPTLKPRARSKSPLGCNFSPTMDNDQLQGILGHGKVSEICRTFIKKTGEGKLQSSPMESGPVPQSHAGSVNRQLKWARLEGVWQRVPVDDDRINDSDVIFRENEHRTRKPNRKSNETLSQWKNLVDKIQKVQREKRDIEAEQVKNVCDQPDSPNPKTNTVTIKTSNDTNDTATKLSNSTVTSPRKPMPPKTLPKPKRPKNNDLQSGVNDVSIIRSINDKASNHVSTPMDNEHKEMHKTVGSNDRTVENKSKQVQESVRNNKTETETGTICTYNNTYDNEHEKSIKTSVDIEYKVETGKSDENANRFDTMDDKITVLKQKQEFRDQDKDKETKTNGNNNAERLQSKQDITDHQAAGLKSVEQFTRMPLDTKPNEETVTSTGVQSSSKLNTLRHDLTVQATEQYKLSSKQRTDTNKLPDATNSLNTPNERSNCNFKPKTVPIKQEMFPKEEDDISSDIIAKVLKVMESFTDNDEQSKYSDVRFFTKSEDLSDVKNSQCRKDYTGDKKTAFLQEDTKTSTGEFCHGQRQQKLLSEISELEERNNEDILENKNITNSKGITNSPCNNPLSPQNNNNRSPCLQRSSFSRSSSLPTTALSHPGSRILYRNGSFVIEPDFIEENEESVETQSLDIENGNITDCSTLGRESKSKSNPNSYSKCKRSQSEADLCDVDCEDNIFIENDGNLTVVENGNYSEKSDLEIHRTLQLEEESYNPPISIEENELVRMRIENKRPVKVKKKSRFGARRSRSFRDFSDTEKPIVKLRRNLSFVEAINDPEQLSQSKRNDSVQSINSTVSIDESPQQYRKMSLDDTKLKSQGFLQKVFSRRKGSVDQGGKKKLSESKESILSKMSLKTIFGGKKGKEQSIEKVLCKEPQTPPIAAFQSDNDIHIMDSAPGSPYSSHRFQRRHTSAEIYDQSSSANSSSRSSLDVLNNRPKPSRLDDQLSVKSFNSSSLSISEQPLRPKSPKPNVMIMRRNSNLSLPSSPVNEVTFDMGGKPIDVAQRKHDSVDSGKIIASNNCNNNNVGGPKHRLNKQISGMDLEKLASLVQNDMTSSNSNDSGIQHDVSVHSSNESLKASGDSSTVPRRRKSPSPKPERPKSEISVRWADLVESTDISPVKRRENGENRPRPKSDLEDNLQLFDEMYEEVYDDLVYFTGGSSLSPDMKPFGSQSSLQLMYSSLQSLDSLRKHDPVEQKPNKRRMSTPHPIKTRLSKVPPKQQKRVSLVRSHSMPESLDKLHRRKRLHTAIGSSNLHDFYVRNFEDDSSSDDGSDISVDQMSLNEKSLSARSSRAQLSTLDEMPEGENRTYAEALWDHITMDPDELRFRAGDLIEIIDMNDKDWWYGALDDHQEGWLPATFVRLRVNQEHFEEDFISRFSEIPEHSSPNLRRISMINTDQGRTNVINEILQAEQDYVKHMKDVVEGYIRHARKRVDMFTEEKISVIFGNIEEIFKFSTQFLETLESAYTKDQAHQSELGKCFLKYSKGFEIYSDYCNNHPSGSAELKDLYRKQKYRHFFEACRLLQEMIEIPLEGFLLNPVQKICKYPLQLAELLKYTPPTHPDYESVRQALASMKKIAALINERKRKMESIEKLARWQHTVEDWQGTDLLERSSELIYSSDINKINSAGWSQDRWFYLFDHQLVYCKKDLLKRNGYSYKGRIDMDECNIIDIEDGKDVQYNVTVKNAWKLHEMHKDKWYLLYAKTQAEKQRWIKAFQKERERVREDQENNFIPDDWKRTLLNRIKASLEKQNSRTVSEIQHRAEFIRGIPSHATLPRSYSKKQTKKRGWFPFGNKHKSKS